MKIHIEGMGINGSLIARHLHRLGIEFTWHDTDEKQVAWQASTGAIYPANSTKFGPDWWCYNVWGEWYTADLFGKHLEAANYWFAHKKPPHEGKYPMYPRSPHNLGAASPPSFHFNAQSFVTETRSLFDGWRVPSAPDEKFYDHYIVSHGYSSRLGRVYWGWTRLVELEYDREVYGFGNRRPSFYFRPDKFVMAYAYPVAGTSYWYAGSSIIAQSPDKRRSLSMEDKYEKWKRNFERLGNGAVRVRDEHQFMEGWRPSAGDGDWLQREGKMIHLRPLWNSGIRHFPEQWRLLAAALGLGG